MQNKTIYKTVKNSTTEPFLVRAILIIISVLFLFILIGLPIAVVFVEGFRKGFDFYKESILEENAFAAIKLTLIVAAIAVPLNTIFGVMASWAITKFNFWGKQLLIRFDD